MSSNIEYEFGDLNQSINRMINRDILKKIKQDEELENSLGEISKYQKWNVHSKGMYQAVGKIITHDELPAGYYELQLTQEGIIVVNKNFISDDYIELPINEFQEIKEDIRNFWNIKDRFKKYGFVYKRGILLYGKQGLGKSFLINGIINELITKQKGLVFSLFNGGDLEVFHTFFRNQLRKIEPDRPVIVVIEDIDGMTLNKNTETELINLLDGVEHSDNVIYLATTNKIEHLEERITNRPSRFDKRYHITAPDALVRKTYIENKVKPDDLKKINLKEWVEKTDGYNLAHIKELIISTMIYDNTFDDTINVINKMRESPEADKDWDSSGKSVGFGNDKTRYLEIDWSDYDNND